MNPLQHHGIPAVLSATALVLLLTGCSSWVRVQEDPILPSGSLRLAQAMAMGTREQVLSARGNAQLLEESGVPVAAIRDGSFGIGRTYCCGGSIERELAVYFYVPPGTRANTGDIVEIRIGNRPRAGTPGRLNTVTRIRQRAGESGDIRWDPPTPGLWRRILHADWMEREGWKYRGGLQKTWYKPPPGSHLAHSNR